MLYLLSMNCSIRNGITHKYSKFLQIRDDKLCRHCDTVHSELPNLGSKSPSRQDEVDTSGQLQACPFQNPLVVISDSVIDFSSKESADDRYRVSLSGP